MAMVDCPHPPLCNGVRRHHDDSNTRAACAARGNAARAGAGASAPKLSGLAAFAEAQKPQNLAKKGLAGLFGTDDVEILRTEKEAGDTYITAVLADQLGDEAVHVKVDSNQGKKPMLITDAEGNELSVRDAAKALDHGGQPQVAGFLDAAPGTGQKIGRVIASDNSVFYRRGQDTWSKHDSTTILNTAELQEKYGDVLPDVGTDHQGAHQDAMDRITAINATAAMHFEDMRPYQKMQAMETLNNLPQMSETELREYAQGSIYAEATTNRLRGNFADVYFNSGVSYGECERRDRAEHAEGCRAIGNRYKHAYNDAARGITRLDPIRECTCK